MVEKTIRNLGLIYVITGGWMLVSIIPLIALGDAGLTWFLLFNGLWTVALGSVMLRAKVISST